MWGQLYAVVAFCVASSIIKLYTYRKIEMKYIIMADLTCTVHRNKHVFEWYAVWGGVGVRGWVAVVHLRRGVLYESGRASRWWEDGSRCITFLPGTNLPWRASVDDSTASEGRRISSVGVAAWVLASDVSHLLRFFAPEAQIVCDSRIRIFPYSLRGHQPSLRDNPHAMLFRSHSVTDSKIYKFFNDWN